MLHNIVRARRPASDLDRPYNNARNNFLFLMT